MSARLAPIALIMILASCVSVVPEEPVAADAVSLLSLAASLDTPLPGDLQALYSVKVPRSSRLRLAVLARPGSGAFGRMSLSEGFGSALAIVDWRDGDLRAQDLDEGCELESGGGLPLAQLEPHAAIRLLGGRLPWPTDELRVVDANAGILSHHRGTIRLQGVPARVVELTLREGGSRIQLEDHTSSLPGRLRIDRGDDWLEMDVVRLAWLPLDGPMDELEILPRCQSGRH